MAAVPVATLARWFGPGAGRHLHALSWNLDPRPVITERRAGSMGAQSALGRGTEDREELARVLLRLADRVARRLRAKGRAGRTITVRIRDPDLHVISRALTLPAAVASTAALHRTGLLLLDQAHPEGRVTLLGISVSKLDELGALQLELAVEGDNPTRPGSPSGAAQLAADRAIDLVRERFGKEAAGRASLLLHPHRGVPDGFRELAER
jgi:DNA polymerase-4